jgi:hypothetical protein
LSGETKHINYHVIVLKGVLLAKIAVVLGVPEAGGTHVEATVALLEDDHVGSKLKVFINFLEELNDDL